MKATDEVLKHAILSRCGQYRYALWRNWDDSLPMVEFIMLNPSTADDKEDDPTIRRCINFAKSWGCGSLKVANLFAFRATDPQELKKCQDPIGPKNYWWLYHDGCKPKYTVCAWGNNGSLHGRSNDYVENKVAFVGYNSLYYLKMNSSGEPSHPLYLKKDLKPRLLTK